MSLSRRLFDLARSNILDFREALRGDDLRESLDEHVTEESHHEDGSVGARAGRTARRVRDVAEEAWERAYEKAQERAHLGRSSRPSEQERLRWFRTLELEPGASADEVRRSYRRLLAQYHPDKFARDPDKQRAATEVARRLTEAYNGILHELDQAP